MQHAFVPQARHAETNDLVRDLMLAAQQECRWLASSGTALPPTDAALIGVRSRGICTRSMLEDSGTRERVEDALETGVEYRVLTSLSADLLIADEVTLLSTDLVVRTPAVVRMLIDYFEVLWAKALPLGTGGGLSTVQRKIIRLAAVGFKDDAIARSLGLSARSVRRHMEKLAIRAGASNRFTLGVAATRRGWV